MTRRYAPATPDVALTIAGSDSGGGAGIQADLKAMAAHGVFGTSVITATTAQNTQGVHGSAVQSPDQVRAQYEAVVDDFDVGAVKTGMLATADVVAAVRDCLAGYDGPVVVDPVMVAATGDRLLTEAAEDVYADLCADATLVTPNVDEAEVLTGLDVDSPAAAREAGERLVERGARAALVKGGHLGGDLVADTLAVAGEGVTDDCGDEDPEVHRFEHPRIDTDATHGSGCVLSSAVAARLASGESLTDAVEASVAFMERAVRYGLDVGEGPGAVHGLVDLRSAADRTPTAESVAAVVEALEAADARALVPEAGLDVAGATAFAESPSATAAVDGRLAVTGAGLRAVRGVRPGVDSRAARHLLSAREIDSGYRFAATVRHGSDVGEAIDALGWPTAALPTAADPADAPAGEAEALGWAIRRALAESDAYDRPVAVIDEGAAGREARTLVLAREAGSLTERLLNLSDLLS